MSRKLEFVPPVVEVLSSGWEPSVVVVRQSVREEAPFAFLAKPDDACCKLERKFSRMGDLKGAADVIHDHFLTNPLAA